jgi:hypothetical protein
MEGSRGINGLSRGTEERLDLRGGLTFFCQGLAQGGHLKNSKPGEAGL